MFQSLLARAREARAIELEGEGSLEGGFTLIELMVVLLIIAILLAIAIPTFLGVTGSAKDRSAQSTLTNVLTESVATYQNSQSYPTIPASSGAVCSTYPCSDAPSNYSSSDPQFNWFNGANSNEACTTSTTSIYKAPRCVSVLPVDVAASTDLQGVVLAVMSPTGTCWWAVNLQAIPATITGDTSAFKAKSGASTAGTYYANSKTLPCYAGEALTANTNAGLNWGTSYSDSAGAN